MNDGCHKPILKGGDNVRINLDKMQQSCERLKTLEHSLNFSLERVNKVIRLFRENEMLEDNQLILTDLSKQIHSQITAVNRMTLAVGKAQELYIASEERISAAIEGGNTRKPGFVTTQTIADKTDFKWSIQ